MRYEIEIISEPTPLEHIRSRAGEIFGDYVKAVVDIEKKIMAIGGELHADEEHTLLEQGSVQQNLWGINMYPDAPELEQIEFDSMINIRPRQNNRSRGVENSETRAAIIAVVQGLIKK